jgi:hypothetical protein
MSAYRSHIVFQTHQSINYIKIHVNRLIVKQNNPIINL